MKFPHYKSQQAFDFAEALMDHCWCPDHYIIPNVKAIIFYGSYRVHTSPYLAELQEYLSSHRVQRIQYMPVNIVVCSVCICCSLVVSESTSSSCLKV